MKYWIDTEFIEDGKVIDLISVGVVCEDGRELYLQNKDCKFKRANPWVRDNVLPYLRWFNVKKMKPEYDQQRPWANPWDTRNGIAWALRQFIDYDTAGFTGFTPELWGYYADYDWVAVCQLFGTMMNLPSGWPKYCRDIKQWCDMLGNPQLPKHGKGEHHALADARWNRDAWFFLQAYEEERWQGALKAHLLDWPARKG